MEGPQLRNCRNLSTSFLLIDLLPTKLFTCRLQLKNFCHLWLGLAAEWHSCLVLCVSCVSVCPASTTPLCPHGHTDTCPQGRPHTHSYNTSHRYRKPHLCKHLFVYLTVSMFTNSRPRSQVLRACMKLRTTA